MPEPHRARSWKRRGRRLLVLGVIIVGLYLARGYILTFFGRLLDASEPPQATDYVMVLGGGRQTRPFAAAALLRAHLAQKALVPTVKLSTDAADGISVPEHQLIIDVLRSRGIPADAIIQLPGEVSNTFDEANVLRTFLESRPPCSVAILTNTYHTRRASWTFRKVLGERFQQVRFVGAPTDGYDSSNWWRFESGFVDYTGEYLKLAFYWLHY
jgi:uncharacterized SAM-binding protein YcdF (DUF218 family)